MSTLPNFLSNQDFCQYTVPNKPYICIHIHSPFPYNISYSSKYHSLQLLLTPLPSNIVAYNLGDGMDHATQPHDFHNWFPMFRDGEEEVYDEVGGLPEPTITLITQSSCQVNIIFLNTYKL